MRNEDYYRRQLYVSVLISILIGLSWYLRANYPILTRWLSISMMSFGIASFIVITFLFGRYSKIYDYEPASFLGTQTNGKQIRGTLKTIGFTAISLSLIGFVFYLFG